MFEQIGKMKFCLKENEEVIMIIILNFNNTNIAKVNVGRSLIFG